MSHQTKRREHETSGRIRRFSEREGHQAIPERLFTSRAATPEFAVECSREGKILPHSCNGRPTEGLLPDQN